MRRTEAKSALGKAGKAPERLLAACTAELQSMREALRQSEARFRGLTEMFSDFYWESDSEHRLTLFRSGGEDVAQTLPQGTPLGKRRWEIAYVSPDAAGWAAHRALLDVHRPFRDFEFSRLGTDGAVRHIAISGDPVFDASGRFQGYRGVGRHISERKAAEAKIARLTRLYAALSQCNQAMVRCKSAAELLPQICRAAVDYGGMKMAWIGFVDPDTRMVPPAACFGEHAEAYLQGIQISVDPDSPLAQGPTGTAIRQNHPVWRQGLGQQPDSSPWRERRARFGWAASAALPLCRDGVAVGALNLYTDEAGAFDDAVRGLLIEMAADISFALDNFARESLRQQAENDLRAFRAAMDATADAIYLVDRASMRFIDVNAAACAMLGLAREDILALGPDGVLSTPREALAHTYDAVIAGDAADPADLLRWRKDGTHTWVELRRRAQRWGDGWIIVTVARDITERKQAEAQLRLAARVFDHTQEAITVTDAGANIVSVNRRFTELTGYSIDEVLGSNPRILASGKQDGEFYRAMWASIHARGYWTGEIWNRHKDGHAFPGLLSISAVRDDNGAVINYVAVFTDISQRIAAEQALRASEEKFAKAFRASPMFITISTLAEGRYIDVNQGFLDATGLARKEVIGRTSRDIGLWKDPAQRQRAIDSLLSNGHLDGFEAELCRKSGESMICELWAEPIEIVGQSCVIWVTNDVTLRKRSEMEIFRLNAELEQRVAARTQALELAKTELEAFSYSVSHDLRAPLRAIHGFGRLLEQQYAGHLDEDGRDMLRRVSAGAQKMGLLIDDLLKLSQISRQPMRSEPVDLSVLAWEAVGDLQADAPGRRVAWVIAPQAPATGDPGLLRVMLQNLIGNAWKYTSKREHARIEFGQTEQEGRSVFFVRDNGAGFDMTRAKDMFGAFQRLHSAAEFPGSGIGLATVARIVQRHGGEIRAEGRAGEGACFYFTL